MKQCVIVMGVAIWLGAPSGFAQTPADKPNIVFILADDMSFDSVSANNPKVLVRDTPFLSTFNSAVAMNAVLNYWPGPTMQSSFESTQDWLSWWPSPGQYPYPKYAKRLPSTTPF